MQVASCACEKLSGTSTAESQVKELFLQDNALLHRSQAAVTKRGFELLPSSAHSPHLSLRLLQVPLKLKEGLRRKCIK